MNLKIWVEKLMNSSDGKINNALEKDCIVSGCYLVEFFGKSNAQIVGNFDDEESAKKAKFLWNNWLESTRRLEVLSKVKEVSKSLNIDTENLGPFEQLDEIRNLAECLLKERENFIKQISTLSVKLLQSNIGKKVLKKSGKPFKSKLLINTISSVINHPILKIPAYTFEEDNSFVECGQCILPKDRNY